MVITGPRARHAGLRRPASAAGRRPSGAPPPGPTGADIDPIRPARSVAFGGYTVLVCRGDGAIDGQDTGLYDMDARVLSRHVLSLDGRRLPAVGSCVGVGDRWAATLHHRREGGNAEGPQLPQDAWAVHVDRRIGCGMAETITVRNESMVPASTRLTIDLDADFIDRLRAPHGAPEAAVTTDWDAGPARLEFRAQRLYKGREDVRALAVSLDPAPTAVEAQADAPTARRVIFDLELEPRAGWTISLTFASFAEGEWRTPDQALARRSLADAWRASRTTITTLEALVGPAVERAADDLLALRAWELEPSTDGSAWIPNAGVPNFTGFFGRDALTAGWQAAMLGVEPLRGALAVAARTQAERMDPWTEAQPGRMVHEMRRGPLSMLGVRPHRAYYGSQTTGSMFLLGLSEAWHWSGDDRLLEQHRDAAFRAIEWAERDGDPDGDGFLEYQRLSPEGLKNQGWKDSDEAIRYPDGRIVPNPIATVEEQAFHHLALQRMAEVLVALEEPLDRADRLLRRAAALRSAWHDAYWMDDERFYALALDPDERQVGTISSNVGHALGTGIVPPDAATSVADRLMADDMFSGWGVRTLSTEHPSYNPFAYHLGAVWPVENATIALGFKRYGLDDHLDQLLDGLFAAVAHCRDLRLPEALTGHDRSDLPTPLPYPGSQSPQAWSASATVQALQVMLGLYPFAPAAVLGLVRPRLPAWLPSVTLHGLRVGDAVTTIRFDRESDGSASHTVLEQMGTLHVLSVPPPDAVSGTDGVVPRLLGWVLDHAPGRTAMALRIATGDDRPLAGRDTDGGRS
jgi:glycogen debranching enzyme